MIHWSIDYHARRVPFSDYWRLCVGSGHAALGLRRDWQRQLVFVRDEIGFRYVRFHGLLNDDMNVVVDPSRLSGRPRISLPDRLHYTSFYDIGALYDAILRAGMKPFVELGFMPSALASGSRTIFYYQANVTPPKDYARWDALIGDLMRFLVDRYGEAEVASWYFEVWNEPNVPEFWAGDMAAYFKLYQHTAGAIKKVLPDARVGGPATTGGAWLVEMREFCARHGVPLDFLSTNHYPGGEELRAHAPRGKQRGPGQMLRTVKRYRQAQRHIQEAKSFYDFVASFANREQGLAQVPRGSLTEEVKKARALAGDMPLIYTEWNAGQGFCSPLADELYPAAFIVKIIIDNEGYVDGYSFWTFSDLFEELTMFGHMPFAGTFGLLTKDGIPKPAFWAYKLLSELGAERYELDRVTSSSTLEIAAFRRGADLQVLLYNQAMPGEPVETEHVELDVVGMPALRHVRAQRIDETHGNPKPLWEAMGTPQYLTQAQAAELKGRSWIATEELPLFPLGGRVRVAIDVPPHGVALLTCSG